jgi:hypothetical protein
LYRASEADVAWLGDRLNRHGEQFGTRVVPDGTGGLVLSPAIGES